VCSNIFISGCGEKLFARCVAKRLALSILDIAYELSGLRRGGTMFFSLRRFLVAFHKDLSEFVIDLM
jgi:hypothetical protein